MEEINLIIDNRRISCPPGTSLLNAAHKNGIKIPTLCHDTHLKPAGACRLCLVEDEKSGRIMAACTTPVSSQLEIRTDSPTIRNHRKNIIRMMMANHPESCIVCNLGNRCELRQVAADLGVGKIDLYPMPIIPAWKRQTLSSSGTSANVSFAASACVPTMNWLLWAPSITISGDSNPVPGPCMKCPLKNPIVPSVGPVYRFVPRVLW